MIETKRLVLRPFEMKEYIIPACCGQAFDLKKGQSITVIDVEGGQVADFFAT